MRCLLLGVKLSPVLLVRRIINYQKSFEKYSQSSSHPSSCILFFFLPEEQIM